MNRYVLNGAAFTSREAAYSYMQQIFRWPDYVGHNLDALWDMLQDLRGVEIEINEARAIPEQLGDYGLRLLDVFGDLQREEGYSVHIYW